MDPPANWIGVAALAISMIGTVASGVLALFANNNKKVSELERKILEQEYQIRRATERLEECEEKHRLHDAKVEILDAKVDSALAPQSPPPPHAGTAPH